MQSIKAVSFYTRSNNVPYKSIPNTPNAEGTIAYAGYHTVNLASPVSLKAGEYFSVILNLGGALPRMVIENDNDSGVDKTKTATAAGKCYFASGKEAPVARGWVDGKSISGGSYNGSIRTFTTTSGGGNDEPS